MNHRKIGVTNKSGFTQELSKSLFSYFMTKSFKVPQRNEKIDINISKKSLVRLRVCKI